MDRENSNKVKQEEGALSVARIKALARNVSLLLYYLRMLLILPTTFQTDADAEAYSVVAAAKAEAERLKIEAEALALTTRLAAEAEAAAIRTRAAADTDIIHEFAREMQRRRLEVQSIAAYGDRTVFVPTEKYGSSMGNALAVGMAASMGHDAVK